MVLAAASCGRAPSTTEQAANLLPPPKPTGIAVATVEITPPAGNANRQIFGCLKREGLIVARGEATIPAQGSVQLVLQAMAPSTMLPDGEYDMWLAINRDGLQSCYPSFGDLYVRETWQLHRMARVKTLADPAVWKERKLSQPESLITIHYHRYDLDYDNIGIWTWDGNYKRTPEQNEIYEVGRDDYGLIYQIDRGEYGDKGDSEKIGMLPRLRASWDRKDGDDKFWKPELGKEIYLIGTKNKVWAERPNTGPQVTAAYIDTPSRLVVELTQLLTSKDLATGKFSIIDDQKSEQKPATVSLVTSAGKTESNYVELNTAAPLDLAERTYHVTMQGFAGAARAVPRGALDDPQLFYDAEAVLGATYTPAATTFRVFAPTATAASVVLYDEATGKKGRALHPLTLGAKGIWEATVAGDWEGKFYLFSLDGPDLSPDREALDINCINAVDNARRARITDLTKTNPADWQSAKAGPALESPVDMVVYEMHVRDFTIAANSGADEKGKYLGFAQPGTRLPGEADITTGLDHLVELGVTHVQLMPIQDFENDESGTNYNWGYVTVDYNSPEGWFATNINNQSRISELKQLIKALHERGIGVILDVVYNHTAASAPFNFLVPRYYFRFNADGSYANGSGCGNEFRTESPMGRKYVLDSLKYWVEEYGVDGFRFDLMALIDLDTMKEAEAMLRKINPAIVLYGEPWPAGPSPMKKQTTKSTIRGTRIGAFNDNFRNALKGSPFDPKGTGFIQEGLGREAVERGLEGSWRDWAERPGQSINYLTCHDNYVLYDKLKTSKPGASDAEIKEMMKLGYVLLFTAQGVPFLHGGEEFARTKQGHGNSYDAPDSINEVDWSLKKKNYELFTYVRDLIAMRKAHPIFRLRSKEQIAAWLEFHPTADPATIMYTLDGSALDGETWKQICVVVNAADFMSTDFALPAGQWHVAFDAGGAVGEERVVEGTVRVRYKSGMILYQH